MRRDRSLVPLSHQHHNALAMCVLTDRSLAQDASPENRARLASRITDRFRVEIANHLELEETLLFPASGSPLVPELLREHRELERLADSLAESATAETLRAFTALLRRHIRKEEDELFEDMQRRLPRETLDALGREFEARAVRLCLTDDF